MIVNNLPPQANPLVGRKQELADIIERLSDPACRLLTIVGPGGIGKTTLAQLVGWQYAKYIPLKTTPFLDGVHLVSIQPLLASELFLLAVADALKLKFAPEEDAEEQLLRHLRSKSILLILDNLEHLLEGTSLITRLLSHAPGVKILVTSRETLNIREEWVYILYGLDYPSRTPNSARLTFDSVQLFVKHAWRIYPEFSLDTEHEGVKHICQLVEGLPLAIELAASWVRSLSTAEIAEEIAQGLGILESRANDIPSRHRTMRAALDTSWNRLTTTEQSVFKRLTVFRGGFTREAAEQATFATRHTLAGLVDKSWMRRNAVGRYDIHELLRQYGEERLHEEASEVTQAHDQHCKYYAQFLEKKSESLFGLEAKQTRDAITSELENIWAYWQWATKHKLGFYIEPSLFTLWLFYDTGERFHEGVNLFEKAAKAFEKSTDSDKNNTLYGKILLYRGALAHSADQPAVAKELLNKSLDILRPLGVDKDLACCLTRLGMITHQYDIDFAHARSYFLSSSAMYHQIGFLEGESEALLWIGITYHYEEELKKAQQYYEEALVAAKANHNLSVTAALNNQLSACAYFDKEYLLAKRYAQESLDYFLSINQVWGVTMSYRAMAMAASGLGQHSQARQYIHQCLTVETEHLLIRHTLSTLFALAKIWVAQGKVESAVGILSMITQSALQTVFKRENQLLEELKTQLPANRFNIAYDRGTQCNFDQSVKELIAELGKAASISVGLTELTNPLTLRELEILRLVAKGLPNKNIAAELHLALGTVKWYMKETLSKLGVENRIQAVNYARELGLID